MAGLIAEASRLPKVERRIISGLKSSFLISMSNFFFVTISSTRPAMLGPMFE